MLVFKISFKPFLKIGLLFPKGTKYGDLLARFLLIDLFAILFTVDLFVISCFLGSLLVLYTVLVSPFLGEFVLTMEDVLILCLFAWDADLKNVTNFVFMCVYQSVCFVISCEALVKDRFNAILKGTRYLRDIKLLKTKST